VDNNSVTDSNELRKISKCLTDIESHDDNGILFNDHMPKMLNGIADRLDCLGIGNVPEKEDLYRSKLIAILEGLECENIPELIKKCTEDQLREIGVSITNEVKKLKNIPFDVIKDFANKVHINTLSDVNFSVIKESLQYHFTGENNALEFYEGDDEKATIKILENIQQTATKLGIKLE
jgi:hypothetical protein